MGCGGGHRRIAPASRDEGVEQQARLGLGERVLGIAEEPLVAILIPSPGSETGIFSGTSSTVDGRTRVV
jgi:hypothetical protein